MGYPDREGEISVLTENPGAALLDALESVLTLDEFLAAQNEVKNVFIHPGIIEAIADICIATRENGSLRLGASPRAGLHLAACARALAVIRGRDFVTDDDIKALCCPVLVHRLLAKSRETNIADIVNELTVERLLRIETR
jgi:MoxR-like ATPase